MNTTTRPKLVYQRGRTLGRSGYEQSLASRLTATVERLDALLCVISNADFSEDDPGNDFQRMNKHIQVAVLDLASELAYEAHEIVTQIHAYDESPDSSWRPAP